MIAYLKYSGNPSRALQQHAEEEEYGGRGDETRGIEMEVGWEGATGRESPFR